MSKWHVASASAPIKIPADQFTKIHQCQKELQICILKWLCRSKAKEMTAVTAAEPEEDTSKTDPQVGGMDRPEGAATGFFFF